jgi:exopolysaccharide biosynthesis polyprenyl glycosylphosphotransferase
MLRRDRIIRMQIHELMDACIFAFSFWLAYFLRSNQGVIDLFSLDPVTPFDRYVWLYLVLIPAAPMVLEAQGFYNRPILCSRQVTGWLLIKGCSIITLGLIFALFLFRLEIARYVIIWFGFISFGLVFIKEELLLIFFKSRLAQSQYRRRFILVGTPEETARLRADLRKRSGEAIDVLTELDLNEAAVHRLVELLHEYSVNGVIVSAKRAFFDQVEAAIRACELEGVEIWLVADFFNTQISRTSFDDCYGWPVLVFSSTPQASWQSVLKQVLDFVLALLMLIVLAVPLAVIALLIKVTSPGPIFFRQQRSGLNGHPFTIYKFRTMVTNAEQLKHELAAMNEMSGPVFKVTNDPRITPIGRLLRKFSLDEFPQLFNVLRGEMSLVGPRPLPVDEVKRFNDLAHRRRLSVKPGLTCLWQISGRNNVKDFKDWVRLDLEYIDNWSFWLDLKILWWTIPVVLLGTGAK